MSRRPVMPFFGIDFYTSAFVIFLPRAIRADYMELLWRQWNEGSLPADEKTLRKLLGLKPKEWRSSWKVLEPKFPLCQDGRRRNERMAEVQANSRAHQRRGGSPLDARTKVLRRTKYEQVLRDPRWQRKRLEVLQAHNFTCDECSATDKELHVHHTLYVSGMMPWEYPADALQVLCDECHQSKHGRRTA